MNQPSHEKQSASRHRGRRPLGDKPLSGAERQRRSRERLRKAGGVEVLVRLDPDTTRVIDAFATARGESRSTIVQWLLDHFADRLNTAYQHVNEMGNSGVPDEEISAFVREHLTAFGILDSINRKRGRR